MYFEAVEPYATGDILDAVENFITGRAPGVNPSFAPPAPAVASECRRVMNMRLDSERRRRAPALPPPDIAPEEKERVGAKFKEWAASMKSETIAADAERDAASKARGEREVRWLRDRGDLVELPGVSVPVSQSLLKQYQVGDDDGDRDVA